MSRDWEKMRHQLLELGERAKAEERLIEVDEFLEIIGHEDEDDATSEKLEDWVARARRMTPDEARRSLEAIVADAYDELERASKGQPFFTLSVRDALAALQNEVIQLERRAGHFESALRRIAVPRRPDGTYNLGREACEQLARKALSTDLDVTELSPHEQISDWAAFAKTEAEVDDPIKARRIDELTAQPEPLAVSSGQLRAVIKELHDRGLSSISLGGLLDRLRVGRLQRPASEYVDVVSIEEGVSSRVLSTLRSRSRSRIGPASLFKNWVSYSPALDHGPVRRAWARTLCRLGVHLFDQYYSLEQGARLYCDACGWEVALRDPGVPSTTPAEEKG